MDILVVGNHRAGRGLGEETARRVCEALRADGHSVMQAVAGRDPISSQEKDLFVIVGGDGSVHHALGDMVRSRTPVYHCPLGTENLFAREFGTGRDVETLRRAIVQWSIEQVDLGRVWSTGPGAGDGRPAFFALMCSLGFDAAVIHRVARTRTGAIRHRSYLRPIVDELISPTLVPLEVHADGEPVVLGRPGVLIVANSRQYGARLDPARRAVMTDGLLDIVFLPFSGRLGLLRWMALLASGRHMDRPDMVYVQAKRVDVKAAGPTACQVDGEASPLAAPLAMEVVPGALRVLSARGLGTRPEQAR